MTERNDIVTQQAEREAMVGEQLRREAISRQRAAELGPPDPYPRSVSWCEGPLGIVVEADGAQWLLPQGGEILPGHLIQRLIRPDWDNLAGSC